MAAGMVQPRMLAAADELAQARIELVQQEAVEAEAALQQPVKGAGRHQCHQRILDRRRVERPAFVLEQCALAEPATRGKGGQRGAAPGRRQRMDLDRSWTMPAQWPARCVLWQSGAPAGMCRNSTSRRNLSRWALLRWGAKGADLRTALIVGGCMVLDANLQ